jgi:hypothetical protein
VQAPPRCANRGNRGLIRQPSEHHGRPAQPKPRRPARIWFSDLFGDCAARAAQSPTGASGPLIEGLDLAFWFTFVGYHMLPSSDPRRGADLASYGLVALLPQGPGSGCQGLGWRPRLSFETMAALQVG